jgi:hypothetical protein
MQTEPGSELWNEVERALDARRSPFEDAGLAARLAREPEAERAVRRLVQRLARLEYIQAAPARPRRGRWLALTAAAGLLAGGAWLARARPAAVLRTPELRLSVQSEAYVPRLARVTLERTRVVAWTHAGERP